MITYNIRLKDGSGNIFLPNILSSYKAKDGTFNIKLSSYYYNNTSESSYQGLAISVNVATKTIANIGTTRHCICSLLVSSNDYTDTSNRLFTRYYYK